MIHRWIAYLAPQVVIEGEAKGADTMARNAAIHLGIHVERYPADWEKFGRAAGPIRNLKMLMEGKPTHVIAFHDDIGKSKGTKDMINQARKAGLDVLLVGRKTEVTLKAYGKGGFGVKN